MSFRPRRLQLSTLNFQHPDMPTTYETLRADIVTAMKARDAATATALRTMDALFADI